MELKMKMNVGYPINIKIQYMCRCGNIHFSWPGENAQKQK